MKRIPIKFRAKSCETGEYLYSSQVFQYEKDLSQGLINGEEVYSINQLVGYDSEGQEVYEGDKLISDSGTEFTAELWAMGVNALDADAIEDGLFKFKLKD